MVALAKTHSFCGTPASDLANRPLASTQFIPAPLRPSKVSVLRHSSSLNAPCHVRSQPTETAVVEPTTTTTASTAPSSNWTSFCAAASGEWDGVTVTFDRDGEAQQLPEYYVPEAFRDWGVELFDWQSQCSMLADETGLKYTTRRMMPTVGCEADAVAFTEDQIAVFVPGSAAITSEGGYTWATIDDIAPKDVFKACYEHCLPLTTGKRVRIVHNLKRMGPDSVWKVLSIEVHNEKWDGPQTGRRELQGCGGGMDPFSQKPALDIAALGGEWKASGVRFVPGSEGALESVQVESEILKIDGLQGLIGLPLGTWSAVNVHGVDAEIVAGVVLEDGRVKVAKQLVSGGKVALAEVLTLSKN